MTVSIGRILGAIAIIVGILEGISDNTWWFDPVGWFILAIALVVVLDWPIAIPIGKKTGGTTA